MNRRRHQQGGSDVAVGRQRRNDVLPEVGRDLRRARQHIGCLTHHDDFFRDGSRSHRDIERHGLSGGDGDRLLLRLESAQLESHDVRAGWQQRHDVVAVLRTHGALNTLECGARDVNRHAGDGEILRVDDAARNRAGRRLRERRLSYRK